MDVWAISLAKVSSMININSIVKTARVVCFEIWGIYEHCKLICILIA
uniref:Uncharacterized protein n=1 Tax=Rhizophora mucronata TaxID=61149 RepID=A0A2P2PD95_RHIMU